MASGDLTDLKPVYLIHGSEELLLDRAVKRLRDRLAKVADLDFNLETFEGDASSADHVVNAANTMPFMSERRLVIVNGVDKMNPADLESLAAYAKDPAPFTCLVLVATKMAKNSKLYKAVSGTGVVFEYTAPKRNEYAGEVVKLFRERGKRIGLQAAEALVEAVGRDLRRLDAEVGKVASYAGANEEVTLADVRETASASAVTSIFDMLDSIGSRDVAKSLRLLHRIIGDGESPLGVHAMLARHVRALVGARALADRRLSPDEIAPSLSMAPWQARNAIRQAMNYTPDELAAALCGLAEAEETMKTSPTDVGLVIERWIVSVAGATAVKR
jgi:DNA polymerase-3 subunit delta